MKLIREIKSKDNIVHFQRFLICTIPFIGKLVLHKIYQADKDEHLHNHPWNFLSLIIKGSYIEKYKKGDQIKVRLRRFLDLRYNNHINFHKIHKMISKEVVSINILFNGRKDWGYDVNGEVISNEEYRINKNK